VTADARPRRRSRRIRCSIGMAWPLPMNGSIATCRSVEDDGEEEAMAS
jgi:hypothetical protein